MSLLTRRRPYDPIDQAERETAAAEVARQRAAAVAAEVDRARSLAELHRETERADQDAARDRRAAQEEETRARRAAELEAAELERQHRAGRRQDRRDRARRAGVRLRPVAPLLAVNGLALVGQVGYGLEHLSPGAAVAVRLAVAVLFATALESIALYVGWHSHVALLAGASTRAARLRVASYTVSGVVAGINYSHFADGWSPTAPAVAYGLVSLLSPWLWGLHSRSALHLVLERAGLVDHTGARFSAERWRAFPLRTRGARRWSIDHGVTDPREAWAGYAAERAARPRREPVRLRRTRVATDTGRDSLETAPAVDVDAPAELPDIDPAPDLDPAPAPVFTQVPEPEPTPAAVAVDTGTAAEDSAVLELLRTDWSGPEIAAPAPTGVPTADPAPAETAIERRSGGLLGTVPQFRSPELPEPTPAPVTQADSIRAALTATGGDVPAALALLADQGVTVDPRYANRVARGMSPRVDTESDRTGARRSATERTTP